MASRLEVEAERLRGELADVENGAELLRGVLAVMADTLDQWADETERGAAPQVDPMRRKADWIRRELRRSVRSV